MRPDLNYIKNKFKEFNTLFFDNQLETPDIILNLRQGSMGLTKQSINSITRQSKIWIEISIREDLPEEEYIDTILHEMIHYWIISTHLKDDTPHGKIFQQKAKEIMTKSSYRITVSFEPSIDYLLQPGDRTRFILTCRIGTEWFISIIPKNSVRLIDKQLKISNNNTIEEMYWYCSNRKIFGTFPTSARGKLIKVDKEMLKNWLQGHKPLMIL